MLTIGLVVILCCVIGIVVGGRVRNKISVVITCAMVCISTLAIASFITFTRVDEDYKKIESYTYITEEKGKPITITVKSDGSNNKEFYEKDNKIYIAETNERFLFVPYCKKEMKEIKLDNKIYNIRYDCTEEMRLNSDD